MSRLEPSVHARAQQAAAGLKVELEQLILGRKLPAWRCCCGAIGCGEAVAIEICPVDSEYYDLIGLSRHWGVKMRDVEAPPDGEFSYVVNIAEFVACDVIAEMFCRHFTGIDIRLS